MLDGGAVIWVPAILITIGVVGIVIPVIPGLLLTLVGVGLWAWDTGGTHAWVIFGICAVWFGAGVTMQFLVPGKRMRDQGVGTRTLLLAVLCAIVGFFVLPVVGAPVGFVLGIFLVEAARSRDRAVAWQRTTLALRAVATSIGIELLAALLIVVTWVIGLLTT